MCVNKDNYKCLCGCTLTQATVIFGVVLIVGGLSSLGGTGGVGFMGFFQILIGILMCVVIAKPRSIPLRKAIYWCYVIYCILLFICLIVVVIIILAVDSIVETSSECKSDRYCTSASNTVDDAARTFLLILVIIWACIYVPITLVGLQIVYYGWKEQIYKDGKRDDEKKEKKEKKKEKEQQQ